MKYRMKGERRDGGEMKYEWRGKGRIQRDGNGKREIKDKEDTAEPRTREFVSVGVVAAAHRGYISWE